MSANSARFRHLIALLAASALLCLLLFPLAAVPMLIARKRYGRQIFVLAHIAMAAGICIAGLLPIGFIYLILAALVAIYQESMDVGLSVAYSGLIALATGTSLAFVGTTLWLKFAGMAQISALKVQETALVTKMNHLYPYLKVKPDLLWSQIPSIVVITMALSLALAVLLEKPLLRRFSRSTPPEDIDHEVIVVVGPEQPAGLLGFQLPEFMVWIAIIAVLGTFLKFNASAWQPTVQKVSLNILNVVMLFYFFQGIAVVATFFKAFRVATIWRVLWYVMLILQLFLLVCMLGFSDYWLGFRQRILRRTAESKLK